ncbi:ribonuclease H-like domain-containing protein [Tanacetum coccineum]
MHDLYTRFVKPIRVSLVYKRNPRHNLEEEAAPSGEQSAPLAPKTAKQLTAKRNQERVKSILLLAIPNEYLLKFHDVPDAKSLWAVIKSRFRVWTRLRYVPKLISQIGGFKLHNIKGNNNEKFLRNLPPSWNQIALIMRNKPDIDEIDIDDLYKNLRVYEDEMKRSSFSTSTSQNLAFLSFENTSSTNEVSTASRDFGVNTAGGISQVSSTPCAHDVACSFFAQPTTSPQLKNKDFQQINEDDFEELDLRWQVAMLTVRCYNYHRKGHFARDCRSRRNQGKRSYGDNGRSNAPTNESSSHALVAQDGLGGYDWSNDFEVEPVNYALMAISSSSSSSSSDNKEMKENTPANDSFSKVDGFHAVPPPITGNFLNSRADISFVGKINKANTQKPKTDYELVNRDKVIIEDRNLNDEDDVSEVQTVSPVKTNETQTSQEPKLKTVVNTGRRVDKPVWDNTKRVNHQKISKYPHLRKTFVPSGVLTRTCLITPVKQNEKRVVHKVSTAWPVSTAKPVSTARPGNPEILLHDHVVVDSGCSSHMTGNKAYLSDYEDYNEVLCLLWKDPKGGTQDSYVAGSSGKYKEPTQEYILLPLHPHRTRILVEDVAPAAHEKPSESSSKDNDGQYSEDVALLKLCECS